MSVLESMEREPGVLRVVRVYKVSNAGASAYSRMGQKPLRNFVVSFLQELIAGYLTVNLDGS